MHVPHAFKYFILILINLILFHSDSFAYDYHLPVEKYKLQNGVTVILEADNSSPLVNIQLWIRIGSCYEGKFLGSGITHLAEHMVFSGEETGISTKIAREMQNLGGELDASTSKEYTHFEVTVPKNNLNKAMELVFSILTKAEFRDNELKKEKDVIAHEMDTLEDNPHRFLADSYFKLAFQGHPYGEPVIGNKNLFRNITKENLWEYYKSNYTPKNMILVIAGDFDIEAVKHEIKRLWETIPEVFAKKNYIPKSPGVIGPLREIVEKEVSSVYIIAGFYGPSLYSGGIYAMDVLAEIAGGGKSSRLVKKLRDKLGLVSSIDASSHTPSCAGIWGVSADLTGYDWGLVLKNILKEIYRFKTEPVTDEELSSAKKRIIRRYISSLETINGRASDLGISEIYTRNSLFCRTYMGGIKNVNKEDIKRCAKKYFRREKESVLVLVPKSSCELKKNITAEEKKDITKIELPNGLIFLIKEDKRLPLITIRIAGHGGLLEEDISGLSCFFSQLLMKENKDLVNKIESKGGGISSYSGSNSFGCAIEVFKEDLVSGLEIVKKIIQEFSATDEKMEIVKKIQLAQIKQEEDSPYGYSLNLAKRIFFGDHPYGNPIFGTKESVAKIDKESVMEFYSRNIRSDKLVISVFGDIDKDEVILLIKDLFEDIQRKIIPREPKKYPLSPKIDRKKQIRDMEQSVIILAYPGTDIYGEDRYAMELLEQVFLGQAGRLFENIREKQGLSYSVGAFNFAGREPGSFVFYIATDPKGAGTAVKLLLNEIDKIRNKGIDEKELERVKNYYLTKIQEEWQSVSGLSNETTLDELYGLGFDYYKKYLENIKKITPGDIKNMAKKYFRDDWYALIEITRE